MLDILYQNYRPIPYFCLGNELSGEARDLAKFYVRIAKALADKSNRSGIPDFSNLQITTPDVSDFFPEIRDIFNDNGEVLIIAGGEPTVTLLGNGRGGRNQELALAFEIEAQGKLNVEFLSAGTDGQGRSYHFIYKETIMRILKEMDSVM